MLISAREACQLLRSAGVGARSAERILACGWAGDPVRTSHSLLYERERVRDLAARPVLPGRTIPEACPRGLFVARREVRADRPAAGVLAELGAGWDDLSLWVALALQLRLDREGPLPFLAVTGGFVTAGGEVQHVRIAKGPGARLELAPPGEWYSRHFEGTRLRTGPGRAWVLHDPVGPRAGAAAV